MTPFIRRWLGQPRPKQYCSFDGGLTMLEHTWERARRAAGADRVVTVVNVDHAPFLRRPRPLRAPGRLVSQPLRRDTGAGVLLTLAAVPDPDALIVLMPSDHFIGPPEAFQQALDEAYRLAALLPRQVVLLAAEPDSPETEYGWIEPSARLPGTHARLVRRFREKPPVPEARALYERGCLWNTMIVAGKAAAFWELARETQPELCARFLELRRAMGRPGEAEAIAAAYAGMPGANFSRDLVERASERAVVLPMRGVQWSDWGRPERVAATLGSAAPVSRAVREFQAAPAFA